MSGLAESKVEQSQPQGTIDQWTSVDDVVDRLYRAARPPRAIRWSRGREIAAGSTLPRIDTRIWGAASCPSWESLGNVNGVKALYEQVEDRGP